GLFRSNREWIRVGLVITVLSGLVAIPTFLTGEPSEKIIKNLPIFSEPLVEEHEEAAEFAIWFTEITALLSVGGLYFSIKKNSFPKPLVIAIVAVHIFTLTVLARTNYLGGKISHPEVRDDFKTP
ncbi:MAG TPA: hypothetical protein VN132_01905, partial [Bdellovibrio sp.]|nr:hypothetical protein [Bdellovibrio sp.]